MIGRQTIELGAAEAAYREAAQRYEARDGSRRLWARDASLWTDDDESRWLGWLLLYADRFDAASLETLLCEYVEERGVKLGQVIHALRVAVTGKPVGFGMFEILEILGRERCLARIDRALGRLS